MATLPLWGFSWEEVTEGDAAELTLAACGLCLSVPSHLALMYELYSFPFPVYQTDHHNVFLGSPQKDGGDLGGWQGGVLECANRVGLWENVSVSIYAKNCSSIAGLRMPRALAINHTPTPHRSSAAEMGF